MEEVARIDKWLWAARIFKTRSIAVDAIKNGRVTIDGVNVKPSRNVKAGETISVRKPPITYSFKILKPIEMRVGAKLLPIPGPDGPWQNKPTSHHGGGTYQARHPQYVPISCRGH